MSRIVVVGSVNVDRVVEVPRIPRHGETVSASVARIEFGGKGGNQAHYAVRTAVESTVALVARVGADADGAALTEALSRQGVDVSGVLAVPDATGQAFILVDASGENQIAVVPGANHRWDAAPLAFDVEPGDVVVLQAEVPADVVAAAARTAHAVNARVVLNAAPYAPGLIELLAAGDVLVVNETEAAEAFGGGMEDMPARLAGVPFDVVITLGAEGSFVSVAPHHASERLPAFPATVVDTVGAGDAFVGALASALAEGAPVQLAARFGAATASLAVSTAGARSEVVTRDRVDGVLEEAVPC